MTNFLSFLGLDGFDVRKIDDIEYTVEISCYFLTKWRDDRLLLHEDILKGPFFNYVDKSLHIIDYLKVSTVPIDKILSVKNARAWVSMVSCLKKSMIIKMLKSN